MAISEIYLQKLLSCMPAAERVEIQIEGVAGSIEGYVSEVKGEFNGLYSVQHIYSDYNEALKESYTIIEVAQILGINKRG